MTTPRALRLAKAKDKDDSLVPFKRQNLTFGNGDKHMEYARRTAEEKKSSTSVKFGQAKLGFMLLEFLNIFYDPEVHTNPVVLYIGAAPGINVAIIAKMYPMISFVLYDPSRFEESLRDCDNILIHDRLFEDSDIKEWKVRKENGDHIFLVSDIRNVKYKTFKNLHTDRAKYIESENLVKEDMLLQQRWVTEIQPAFSSLKFRLPWNEPWMDASSLYFSYLDGYVFVQAFESQTSSETRLVPYSPDNKVYEKRQWNTKLYQDCCFYHNTITRDKIKFKHPLKSIDHTINTTQLSRIGLTDDYDSTLASYIIVEYLSKFNIPITLEHFYTLARELFIEFGKGFYWDRNLAGIRKKQKFINEDGTVRAQVRKSQDSGSDAD